MKNAKKIVMGGVAALALVTASVMGTMAYLKSNDTVTNTFTVGNVNITLDEAKTNANGDGTVVEGDEADRVKENSYKLMPGHSYTKDPTIHVTEDSEDCYLFITVDDEIAALEDETTVADQIEANNWKVVERDEDNNYTVYVYAVGEDDKTAVAGNTDIPVFGNFKIQDDVNSTVLSKYEGKTLIVNGYAIQKDGLEGTDVADIWATLANK